MELTQRTITEFVTLLASEAPAPGGGSAAALSGALGAALAGMVCSLTVGKPRYAEYQELVEKSRTHANQLNARFLELMEQDNAVYQTMSAAFRMPKETEKEKDLRSAAIQESLKGCTETPLEQMELALETLTLTAKLVGHSNASAVSDLGVAALSLRAAMQSAWLNVRINIGSFHNKELAESYRKRGEELLEKALPLAEEIYQSVLNQIS